MSAAQTIIDDLKRADRLTFENLETVAIALQHIMPAVSEHLRRTDIVVTPKGDTETAQDAE